MSTVANILKWIIEERNYNVSEAEVFEKLREVPISNDTQKISTAHYQTPTIA